LKVKIGDVIYNSEEEPIMIILSKGEKKQIEDMHPKATKYCSYPDREEWTKGNYEGINKWMGIPNKEE